MEISLCMIVKNEEHVLERCLKPMSHLVDEIILVDTGSNDHTKEIGEKYNAKIYDFDWCDDFAKARNYSFEKATKEYIMWLDADDYILESDIENLKILKAHLDPSFDVVNMPYSLVRDADGNTIISLRRNRIVKRENGYKWIGKVHEYLAVYGHTYHSDIYVRHDKPHPHTDRNLKIFRKMQENGEIFCPRDLFYFANELYYNHLIDEAITYYLDFLETNAWIEDKKTATLNLARCYEINHQLKDQLDILLNSLKWAKPTAEICCLIADNFLENTQYETAIFWYKTAMTCIPSKDALSLQNKDYYTWIPAIQLCVCYSRLNDYYTAYYFNELSSQIGGDKNKTSYNREYLLKKLEENKIPIPTFSTQLLDARFII
ncbi:glycosyltransferase family 2 protein [Niameybacter massiliensis]|uniref:Glycosyltransferase family 2 protein n=1 Tax=Holtiella tumoricola TaxID=3018743 RepID=A0AA42DJF1_9FIRM|nr:glycosyltransferase family 2 protein [Holtiella tumoricola]MDA3729989.1 glycosyltransferase family 2 protein [Holtiella tumoricola]